MKRVLPIAVVFGGCLAVLAQEQRVITTRSLLAEMVDLATLAEYPDPPFTCRQFSSYDRASTSPDDAATWFANGDAGKFLRVEERGGRKEFVMMDAAGPGAIVRIWSANPTGTLRIYLDQDEKPLVEAPMGDLLGGQVPGVPAPIAGFRSRGWNSYFPIPYAKHCKVTSDQEGFYYHVGYRTYPAATAVRTFTPAELEELAPYTHELAAKLSFPRERKTAAGAPRPQTLALEAGGKAARRFDGRGAIVEMQCALAGASLGDAAAPWRNILLTMSFDGERTVAVPLGDFFGGGPGVNAYASLPLGVTRDGVMWSRWVMPFQKEAVIELENRGPLPVSVSLAVERQDYRWTDRSMHFHAQWKGEHELPTRPMRDWNYLHATGQGAFVGAAFSIANPNKIWWGEGDEKIYVDGETFPSFFGTGTEDYYGYAWGSPERFTHAYHSQPRCDGPGNYGYTAINRWHILDRIPFQRDFRFDMEIWHWTETIKVHISAVTYWYARPGGKGDADAPTAEQAALRPMPKYEPPRTPGAIEGESMVIVERTGNPQRQDLDGCSGETQLWWRDGKPGERLVLEFPVSESGRYRVFVRCVKARDYGISQLYLNDQTAGEPLDLYSPTVAAGQEVAVGEFTLPAGSNRLTVEIVGANEKGTKDYMFGLDYLRLERVP